MRNRGFSAAVLRDSEVERKKARVVSVFTIARWGHPKRRDKDLAYFHVTTLSITEDSPCPTPLKTFNPRGKILPVKCLFRTFKIRY